MFRSWPRFVTILCMVGLMASCLVAPASALDDETEAMWNKVARTIQTQNPNLQFDFRRSLVLTEAATAPYRELYPQPLEYRRMRDNRNTGGVVFGRPPEKIEPLRIAKFDYVLLPEKEGESRRVELRFGLTDGTLKKVEVNAAVITPMTAAGIDGRLVLFTVTRAKGAAVHPALEGHRLAYRPAIADNFPFTGGILFTRLTIKTGDDVAKEINVASVLTEKPWTLTEKDLALPRISNDASDSSLEFILRPVPRNDKENVEPLAVSQAMNRDVFKSFTKTELRLMTEYQEAVFVGRIVFGARKGWFTEFDTGAKWGANWLRMIEELGPIYKSNQVRALDSGVLHREMLDWAKNYQGKDIDQVLPADFELK